ncbi:MAG: hypothetical protein RL417_2202 [Pseudomonadota bacterium]|jgi:hypothetical protein
MSEKNQPKEALPNLFLDIKLAKLARPAEPHEAEKAFESRNRSEEFEAKSA